MRVFIATLVVLAASYGCSEKPVPPEVQLALSQQESLRGAGVSIYAPQEFRAYQQELSAGQDLLEVERRRWFVWRDYDKIAVAFQDILAHGEKVSEKVKSIRKLENDDISTKQRDLTVKLALLRGLSENLKDRRLAINKLVQAEIRLSETKSYAAAGKSKEALRCLNDASHDIAGAVAVAKLVLARYTDRNEITRWRELVERAVANSRRQGSELLVVCKAERKITLYRGGVPVKSWEAGMGFNYLSDKLYSGDKATPEGNYQISRKIAGSKYFQALLINYPNSEDQQRYLRARRSGQIPRGAGIGNLIEIHGGGNAGMTNGCVALDNRDMATLYREICVNTPVVIVGTTDYNNFIAAALDDLC
ncbi:MAG: L,D-transpeptidase [Desulfobulbaceae bacterium]|nr:L,D-transpeptidase [Desulfobulbaceae bacterium]